MTAHPDPRGPEELEAGRHLEEAWAANRERIAAEARAKAAAGFWHALESRRGAAPGGAGQTVTRITARRRASAHSGHTSGGTRP